ncbi:hypothetical protein GH714_040660 [Hevea brasiliensis]|uniref:Pentacotripeptide-repeat region of PRORP domain-containing protein n=1 Tax=Hevea brasiliensis TaxID=3981 RepID=A0A6A6KYU3_HEVBR|nr:hypothetical protein GH714_040660 [Hevea brasiliensis]
MFIQYPSLLLELAKSHQTLSITKQLHASITRVHLSHDSFYATKILRFYGLNNDLRSACNLFDKTPQRSVFLWNSMIRAFARAHKFDEALSLYTKMLGTQIRPDNFTYACLIRACHENFDLDGLRLVHGGVIVSGLALDSFPVVHWMRENGKQQPDGYTLVGIISGSALVSMYSRFKCMNLAYGVFISLCQPDLVAWSALITGYSRYGDHKKALFFYRNLSVEGKKSDSILIASILVAAAHLADVRCGSEIHGYVLRHGFESNVKAFKLFEEMIETGMKPDESTFSSLLCACCHSGLVKAGREVFRRMMDEFCIQPKTEHYVHIVKLLGTVGELKEAYNFILSLKQPVDSGIWGALLSCCHSHRSYELAEIVSQHLFDNEPRKGAYRVMLSNSYAGDGRWDDVKKMRDDMDNVGVRKIPGVSWIGDMLRKLEMVIGELGGDLAL